MENSYTDSPRAPEGAEQHSGMLSEPIPMPGFNGPDDGDASNSGKPYLRYKDGRVEAKGVKLSPMVARMLEMLGKDFSWYTQGELEAANLACAIDCNLVDDPDGVNFLDGLFLEEHERQEDNEEIASDPYRITTLRPGRGHIYDAPEKSVNSAMRTNSFGERILAERKLAEEAIASGKAADNGLYNMSS